MIRESDPGGVIPDPFILIIGRVGQCWDGGRLLLLFLPQSQPLVFCAFGIRKTIPSDTTFKILCCRSVLKLWSLIRAANTEKDLPVSFTLVGGSTGFQVHGPSSTIK